MTHKITLIPGDGIGPEVAAAARRVIDASGVSIEWEEVRGARGRKFVHRFFAMGGREIRAAQRSGIEGADCDADC